MPYLAVPLRLEARLLGIGGDHAIVAPCPAVIVSRLCKHHEQKRILTIIDFWREAFSW